MFLAKKKKKKFAKCSQKVMDDWNTQYNTTTPIITSGGFSEDAKSLSQQQSSNTNKILIGLGIVVLGLVGYISLKK